MDQLRRSDGTTVSIVAASAALFDVEERDIAGLARALRSEPPIAWPPEYNGQAYRDWQRALLARHPTEAGFAGWYLVGDGELVGTCGFKGPPDADGTVEIGYSVIAPRRRRGYATAAVNLLVDFAFDDPRVSAVAAETLSDGDASVGVLMACGFAPDGERLDPEDGKVLRFARKRRA